MLQRRDLASTAATCRALFIGGIRRWQIHAPTHLPTTRTWKLSGRIGGRARIPTAASGAGPNSAASKYTRWFFESTVIVRAPRSVGTLSTVWYFPSTSLTTLSVPSPPLELNARPRPESKPAPSGLDPIAGVAITLSVGISMTAIILLSQAANSFLFFTSMARPDGDSHGARDAWRSTAGLPASISM